MNEKEKVEGIVITDKDVTKFKIRMIDDVVSDARHASDENEKYKSLIIAYKMIKEILEKRGLI